MSTYGAKYLQWAPFQALTPDESAVAYPKYGTPQNLGPLVQVSDDITTYDAEDYGDDVLQEADSQFQKANIDIEVTELPMAVASPMFGATLTEAQDVEYGSEDTAPWGGLAFFICKKIKGVRKFQGIYYPKVQASRKGATYNTKGQSITFAHDKLHMIATACAKGKYQVKSKLLDSEEEAKTWVDDKIKETV